MTKSQTTGRSTSKHYSAIDWVSIYKDTDEDKYFIRYTTPQKKQKTKLIAYTKKEYEKARKLIKEQLVKTQPHDREAKIYELFPRKTKHSNPKNKALSIEDKYDFTGTWARRQALEYFQKEVKQKHSETYEGTVLGTIMELVNKNGHAKTFSGETVRDHFKERYMNPESHSSHSGWKQSRGHIKKFLIYIYDKKYDDSKYWKGVSFPTEKEIKRKGIKFRKGVTRIHYERTFIPTLLKEIMSLGSEGNEGQFKQGMMNQLWLGVRPHDGTKVEILDSAIKYEVSKTEKGHRKLETVPSKKDKYLGAYLHLIKAKAYDVRLTKDSRVVGDLRGSEAYSQIMERCGEERYIKTDRYCLRHTALTWWLRSGLGVHEVREMARHTTLSNLDKTYVNKDIEDHREWSEAMPINIANLIPHTWGGFLIESLMDLYWPELKNGEVPEEKFFKDLLKILKKDEANERKAVIL